LFKSLGIITRPVAVSCELHNKHKSSTKTGEFHGISEHLLTSEEALFFKPLIIITTAEG
jgi:hypothetical protein